MILFAFADVRTTLAWSFQSSFNLLKRRLQISSKMKLWTVLVVLQCLTVCFSIVCCRPRMRGMRNNSNSNNNNNNRRTRLRNNRRVTGTHRARRRLILSRDSQPESVENMDKIIRQLTAEQIQLRPDSSEESRSQHWNLDELDNLMPDVGKCKLIKLIFTLLQMGDHNNNNNKDWAVRGLNLPEVDCKIGQIMTMFLSKRANLGRYSWVLFYKVKIQGGPCFKLPYVPYTG